MTLPKPETMLTYASILEKPQYVVQNGIRYQLATGEVIEAACSALRQRAAATPSSPQDREAAVLPRATDIKFNDLPVGNVLDHESAYDLFEALRDATANTWHETAARHLAYHRIRALSPHTGEAEVSAEDRAKPKGSV